MNPRPIAILAPRIAGLIVVGGIFGGFVLQSQFKYSDAAKNLTVLANGGRGDLATPKSYHLVLTGAVSIHSITQGLTLTADKVTCETQADKQGRNEIRHATADGSVHLVKMVSSAGAKQTTDIRGTSGDLNVQPTGDIVKLAGPVRIESIDPRQHQTMLATGTSGVVTLEHTNAAKFGNGLREGTLEGPVRVTLDHAPAAGSRATSTVIATGDRMDFANAGSEPVVRLTGHVEIHGKGADSMGDFTGIGRATLHLNQAFQVVSSEVGS